MFAMERRRWTVNNKAFPKRIRERVFEYIREDWSPVQIAGYLKLNDDFSIAPQTIYNWIHDDKDRGGELYKHCRHKLKKRKKCLHKASAKHIPNRRSIHERPDFLPTDFGHFEMDTIVAKGHKEAIVTIVEKSTSFLFMAKLKKRFNPLDPAKTVVTLLAPFKDKIKSITTDNGLEFRAHQHISDKLNVPIFFADPYASWQKGAIENANKLIRQYIPKSSDFSEVTPPLTQQILYKINHRPREKLNFSSPLDAFILFYR